MKRFFDLTLACVFLLILSPLFLGLAALVKISDGGPVFYTQERVGWKGRPFRILKFRSMRVGADKMGLSITRSGDPRITSIGKFLRATKMDELPQLFNVLVGQMSWVGPRPEVPKYVALYTTEQRRILDLRPGITDVASIKFRDEEVLLAKASDPERFYIDYCIPKKAEMNLRYASRATVFSDVGVILSTVRALVMRSKSHEP